VRKYFKTTIVITILLTLGVVIAGQKFLRRGKTAEQQSTVVRIEQIKRGDLTEFVSAPGYIEPKTKVNISARVSARIVEMPFEEGDRVTKGDPNASPPIPASLLIRLDSKDLESRLSSAQAHLKAQQAQLEVARAQLAARRASLIGTKSSLDKAQSDLDRQRKLLATMDISPSAFDETKLRFDELKAQYEAAMLQIQAEEMGLVVAQHNLESQAALVAEAVEAVDYTIMRSPIDGIVTRINAEIGELVMTGTMNNPGTVIMTVADLSKMLLVAEVDEADVGKLKVGQEAVIRVQAFWEEKFKGIVDTIALTHDLSSTSRAKYFRTEILIQGDVARLYSGLTADVDIYTAKHADIIKVPSQAVLGRKVDDLPLDIRKDNPNVDVNKTDVMVVYRVVDGKTVVTPVTIGPGDLTHIIIKSGIKEDDKIVIGPYKVLEGLKHDQKVRDEQEVEAEKKAKEKKDSKKDAAEQKAGASAEAAGK